MTLPWLPSTLPKRTATHFISVLPAKVWMSISQMRLSLIHISAVKRVSPEKFLLGEVWEDATTKCGFDHRRTYLRGKGLDSVMNLSLIHI